MGEFRAEVVRLRGVVAGCAESAATCNAGNVGADVRVGDVAKGGFEQHWQWLRAALDKAKTAKGDERVTLAREADGQLAELAKESGESGSAGEAQEFSRARKEANEVLARGEFQRGVSWGTGVSDRKLMMMLCGALLLLIAGVSIVAPQNAENDPRPTTTNSGPMGAKAAYLMLGRWGERSRSGTALSLNWMMD